MARLWTAGFETGDFTTEGAVQLGTGNSFSSATVRSGSLALTGAATGEFRFTGYSETLGVTHFFRAYLNFASLPSFALSFMDIGGGNTRLRLNTNGTISLTYTSGNTVLVTTASAVALGEWICFELAFQPNTGAADYIEARINGTSIGTASNLSITDVPTARMSLNMGDNAGAAFTADDVALNDSTGAAQNSWPGSGKIVLLKPISDNAGGTGWTLGTGTALGGNGFAALDNSPPTGVADLAVGSDPKQIRNASANANTNYDANLTSYASAGISAGAVINALVPFVSTAAPVVTSAKLGTIGVASNPAIASVALGAGGTAGAFWSGVAGATYPTGWKLSYGTTTYAPAVTLGTSPVMRVTQVTSSTRIAVVCALGVYVDYTPATPDRKKPLHKNQVAVMRPVLR